MVVVGGWWSLVAGGVVAGWWRVGDQEFVFWRGEGDCGRGEAVGGER